jgi:hypothetical protein
MFFVAVLVIAYVFLYLSGRYYLREGYTNPALRLLNNVPPQPGSV